jgi:MoaA/NifB/PqqE/SkfB family radical SAM enzyme
MIAKKNFLLWLLPEMAKYKLFRSIGLIKINPFVLTFSVTAACQSLCKTCRIGEMHRCNPERVAKDLTLDEIEKIFSSMQSVYYFNISGGEPYLRSDLPEIVELACRFLKPKIIHIPTNAIAVKTIYEQTKKIIEIIKSYQSGIILTVKPSIDGVGDRHDEIRGIKGNFEKLLETIQVLKELEKVYSNFYLELGTVVSNYNIDQLDQIEDFVHSLNIKGYRNEIAEQRAEFFNIGDPITPSGEIYETLMANFSKKIIDNITHKHKLARTTEAIRLVYYQLAAKILKEKKQVIPCYAGISNVHINHDGGVWPCCVLGYSKEFGNLRDYDYDFQKVWHSNEAKIVRSYIKRKSCSCPLANQAYSNILLDFKSLAKAAYTVALLQLK